VNRSLAAIGVIGILGSMAVPALGVARKPTSDEKQLFLAIAKEQMDATSIVRWRVSGISPRIAVVRSRDANNDQRAIVIRKGLGGWATVAGPGTSSVGCNILGPMERVELGERMLRPCEG
jgi:hypothetical protein